MKLSVVSILSVLGVASAFVPAPVSHTGTAALRMADAAPAEDAAPPAEEIAAEPTTTPPPQKVPLLGRAPLAGPEPIFLGEMYWDKITTEWGSAETGAFVRAAELKHGRSAMLATVGFAFHKLGLTFDKISVHEYLSVTQGVRFADLQAMTPLEALKAVPLEGLTQMFVAIAAVEIYELTHANGAIQYNERVAPGLQPGGLTGDLGFNPLNINVDDRRRLVELQNGRAAMFCIMAWIAHDAVQGSVPLPLPWN